MELSAQQIIESLHVLGSEHDRQGMKRFGINVERALGISVRTLREIAKEIQREAKQHHSSSPKVLLHTLAEELWEMGWHESRLLAILIEHPASMNAEQIESWVRDVDSWDVCDQLCSNLLVKNDYARERIIAWCADEEEFVRRVGIVMIAQIAVHDKAASNAALEELLPLLEQYAFDKRNFVKKAVNWSLRQIGKRNAYLLEAATACAERIQAQGTPSARWIAADALREFAKLPEDYFVRKKVSPKRLVNMDNT
ncbi:MAG: DNA alkylation repair protein [Candidatus Kapabacteria bacterium]|jgi:3-methyladenine DNA glycosylase AlkD|nr:DNA alkylation repair protein [Candidatus Kapabacteria bacterium]